jgi:hypothetical protein
MTRWRKVIAAILAILALLGVVVDFFDLFWDQPTSGQQLWLRFFTGVAMIATI